MKRQILYKEFRSYKVWIVIFIMLFLGVIMGWLLNEFDQTYTCWENNKEDTQNLCIGWANHKVLEKESYNNNFGSNVLQQKYWIEVYEQCMEDYNV